MADRIKGITIEIGGDTTGLRKALNGVNSEIRNTQSQLKDVERLLKLDPSNVELLRQKQRLLSEAVEETKSKLDTLKDAERQVQEQFARGEVTQQQYDGLQREILETEERLKALEEQAKASNAALDLQAASAKLEEFGNKATAAGKKIMPVSAAVTGIGVAAVKTTADFDEAMSKVSAISGVTGEQFEQLRDKAREMGEKTKFSATEAAEAFTYMAMAGWDAEKMMAGIDGIMNLSAADGLDLATTSDIVTDALTAFGLQASESAHFADVLAKASSSANTNVSMLGESFKYVAPIAGTLGYSAEDTAVALGLMANAGIKGSQAGTTLKTALANMASPTNNMVGVMNRLGISIENSDGGMKSLAEVMDMLRERFAVTTDEEVKANYAMQEQAMIANSLALGHTGLAEELAKMSDSERQLAIEYGKGCEILEAMTEAELKKIAKDKLDIKLTKKRTLTAEEYDTIAYQLGKETLTGLTEAEQAAAAATLFGKEAMAGMLNIINASEEDYNKLTEAINNADGTAQSMADTMQDNLNGQLTILKSQLQEAAISIGDTLIPAIRNLVKIIQTCMDWFNGLNDSQKQMVVANGLVVAAIGPLLIGVGKLATGLSSIITLVSTAGPAIGALGAAGGPVLVTVAAVTALGAAFLSAKKDAVDYYSEAAQLSDAELENKAAVESLMESYENLTNIRKGTVLEVESQAQKENDLWKELQNITDENGRVKAGYEDRAAFITSTLSSALGTEISITDGVIQNYKDLQTEIAGLIEQKRAEAMLSAYQGEYAEAVSNTKRAQSELAEATANAKSATDEYNAAVAKQNELQAEQARIMREYMNDTSNNELGNMYYELQEQIDVTGETLAGLKAHMDENNLTMENARLAIESYNTTIANYEGASAAIISGDQAKISEALWLLQNDFKTTETATRESLIAQNTAIQTELANARAAFEQGSPNITQAYIDGLADLAVRSQAELDKLPEIASQSMAAIETEMEIAGQNATAGYALGLQSGTQQIEEAAKQVTDSSVNAVKTALDSHSPSEVTKEIGRDGFDAGLAVGIAEGAQQVKEAVVTVTKSATETLKSNLNMSQADFASFQSTTSVSWSSWSATLISTLKTMLSQINSDTNAGMQKMQVTVTTYLTNIRKNWEQQLKEIQKEHSDSMDAVNLKTADTMTEMSETIQTQTAQMKEDAITAMNEMVSGMDEELSEVEPTIRNGFEPGVEYITSLIGEARTWGNHMMQELIQGLEDYLDELEDVCEEIADTISDNLHFTRPERGSLRDYEEWMPHFMQGLAKGIADNRYLVAEQIQRLTDDMAVLQGGGSNKPVINFTNRSVLILDGEQIAETVDAYLGEDYE